MSVRRYAINTTLLARHNAAYLLEWYGYYTPNGTQLGTDFIPDSANYQDGKVVLENLSILAEYEPISRPPALRGAFGAVRWLLNRPEHIRAWRDNLPEKEYRAAILYCKHAVFPPPEGKLTPLARINRDGTMTDLQR